MRIENPVVANMVELDHQLVYEARRLINGANVHRVKEMIFVYEQAVSLHNAGWPAPNLCVAAYEKKLREFVARNRRHLLANPRNAA